GADVVLIAEHPMSVERCCELIQRRHARGKDFSIVVVAEGYPLTFDSGDAHAQDTVSEQLDQFGHVRFGGVGERLGREIESRTGFETRVTTLGHVQRGGSPSAYDRVLATRYGLLAADLVLSGQFGQMAAMRGSEIVPVPLADAVAQLKTVPRELLDLAATFFG